MSFLLSLLVSSSAIFAASVHSRPSSVLAHSFYSQLGEIYPEHASDAGLYRFDGKATDYASQPETRYAEFLKRWSAQVETLAARHAGDREMWIDLDLMRRTIELGEAQLTFAQKEIRFYPASEIIYGSLFTLVNPQTSATRKRKAGARFRAMMEQRTLSHWLKEMRDSVAAATPEKLWPHREQVADYLENSRLMADEVATLLREGRVYDEALFQEFTAQVAAVDDFIRENILPRARATNLPRAHYEHELRRYGITISPDELKRRALEDYRILMPELRKLAERIGAELGLPKSERTPFHVSAALRAQGITGTDELMRFTHDIVAEIEAIIRREDLMTLAQVPPQIRIGTAAENVITPFQHVNVPPALAPNAADVPEYVFPVTAEGLPMDEDCSYRAAAMTLTAHEVFGHGLQFCHLSTSGTRVRATMGTNSTVLEGWAMYIEDLMMPYHEPRERYGAVQSILFRVGRAFLEPMVQAG
ncbi:MAG TPA: DUF885 family protein, partial [Bdellovibrionales bacterium]|nr:DUF885 family protein [Bdellovibrionales bacterium]